jgi:hypothetical protein
MSNAIVSYNSTDWTQAEFPYPCKFIGMPAEFYHKMPESSQSQFKLLPDQPELYAGMHIRREWEIKETDDMWLGSCLHAVLLEGHPIVEIPADALTSNGQRRGKTWESWELAHKGEFYLLPKDVVRVRSMCDGLMTDPKCAALLSAPGECETSYFWIDSETGLPLRARIDKLAEFNGATVIGDLKATNIDVADARQVGMKVLAFGYHQQGAHYLDAVREVTGEEPAGFAFLFVRNKPPYNARLWRLGAEEIALGRRRNLAAKQDLVRRLESDDWTGPTHGIENQIVLPAWAYGKMGENVTPDWADFANFNGEGTET